LTRTKLERIIAHAIGNSPKGSNVNAMAAKVADAIDIALIMESGEPGGGAPGLAGDLPANPTSVSFVEDLPPSRIVAPPDALSVPPPGAPAMMITAVGEEWDPKELVSVLEAKTPLNLEIQITMLNNTTRELVLSRNIVIVHGTDTVRLEYAPDGVSSIDGGSVRRVFGMEQTSIDITAAIDGIRDDAAKMWSQVNVAPRPPAIMTTPRMIG
jgi:hypothetical protein